VQAEQKRKQNDMAQAEFPSRYAITFGEVAVLHIGRVAGVIFGDRMDGD
jgi:hypothetical protein